MGTSDFAFETLLRCSTVGSHIFSVVLAHVMFQRFAVGFGRRLPPRLLSAGIEVIRQVLAIGMADFPAGW
jgi:hypothetical protein